MRTVAYRLDTTRGNVYELDDNGAVVARSNGPKGWDYSGKWCILGFATRHNAHRIISLVEAVAGVPIGQGWIHDMDHGTHRMWGGERVRSIRPVAR